MSMILRATIVAALVIAASAAVCDSNVTTANPYRHSNCTGYVQCETQLCGCAGVKGTNNSCLVNTTVNCATLTTCVKNFMGCLDSLTNARSNASDPCNMWAVTLHAQLLQTVVTAYNGSKIQSYCAQRACQLRNISGKDSCDMGVNFTAVCIPTSVKARLVTATLRLGGNDFGVLLETAKGREQLRVALVSDIAVLLGINPIFVEILSLRVGSLIIEFAITEGVNVTATSILSNIAAVAKNSSWLSSVKKVYATVSNETLTVEGFTATIVTTTGPGGVTPSPFPSFTASGASGPSTNAGETTGAPSISGASAVSTLAVAVFAAMAMLL